MAIKIFTQQECPQCPKAKQIGKELINQGIEVEFYDIKEPQGLAESIMHDIMSTPSIIIEKEGKTVKEFLGQAPEIEEVKKWL